MTLEAAAQALAPEAVVSEPSATEAEPDYGAVYDKLTAEAPIEAESAPAEAAEAAPEPEPQPELQPEPTPDVEAPTDVPTALRKHWSALPEEARDAVLTSQREMSRKLSDMGRQVQGLSPIKDVLINASKDLPALMNMRPEQVAEEVVVLAKAVADFRTKPLETFISLAKEHNMIDALRQAFGGQGQEAQSTAALQTELRQLKDQLARAANPDFIREQVSAITMQERALSEVTEYAASKEHWAEVEEDLPAFIAAVQRVNPDASHKDVLDRAYDLALQEKRPDLKAPAKTAVEAVPQPDPERAKAAIEAKSVNVTGRTTGKPRELTEEEAYEAAWNRAQRK
jgi:hypothetical protein